jgi:hypothetical protein
MDLLTNLLVANSEHLVVGTNTDHHQLSTLSKGWKFSVVRPVDPILKQQRGGGGTASILQQFCPECGKPASKTCTRCKAVAYCSFDCQKLQWKANKKECQAL